jgi:Fuc2NAc and GlcNAc transferase
MIYFLVFFVSIFGTYIFREFAKKRSFIDHPNSRSSHKIATPTGGGVAIVVSFFIGSFYLYYNSMVSSELFFATLSGLVLVVVSFIDDLIELSPKFRVIAQLTSLVLGFYFLGVFREFDIWIIIFLLFASLWLINLYNFMDGIDGYAASEAIFVSIGAYLIYGNDLFLILAISVFGFLIFNWHKASIFMGDVGSTFLGYLFSIFAIYNFNSIYDLTIWYMLLAIFIFDATLTLFYRFKNGEKLSTAHKKHLFQRLNQSGYSHSQVVLMLIALNLLFFILIYNFYESDILFLIFIGYNLLLYYISEIIDKKRGFDV